MTDNPDNHHRRSTRLQGYDYSQAGMYFITICTQNRESLFGHVTHGEMQLYKAGEIAVKEWGKTPQLRANVIMDEFVVMPNHIHGIVFITESDGNGRGVSQFAPDKSHPDTGVSQYDTGRGVTHYNMGRGVRHYAPTAKFQSPSHTIGAIIRGFKSAVTRQINEMRNTPGVPVWQRNYYDHIIRNEQSLHRIREYIINNPVNWQLDREHPVADGHML